MFETLCTLVETESDDFADKWQALQNQRKSNVMNAF